MDRSASRIYFDATNDRLVYVGVPATEDYWDEHWLSELVVHKIRRANRLVLRVTQDYLPPGAAVLDAGCGLAGTVFGLHYAGYRAYGIDFARRTVSLVNQHAPELNVSVADVRDVQRFPDESIDGCWSLGVIEHFYEGYEAVMREMRRLLRPGGYAFVTVPSLSPLRRLKASLGYYPPYTKQEREANFYQFALSSDTVKANFEKHGFRLLKQRPISGFKGLKDECGAGREFLQWMYESRALPVRAAKAILEKAMVPVTYHALLYVFQR